MQAATAILPQNVRTYANNNGLLITRQANTYDQILCQEKNLWDALISEGLDEICCPQGRAPYDQKPYIKMPDSGRRFKEMDSVLVGTNPPGAGSTTVAVVQTEVPVGYDGVIDTVICGISAGLSGSTGFVEGSGTLVWRLAADAIANPRYLRNLGNIQFSLGDLKIPFATENSSLRVYSGDLITFYAVFDSSGSGVLQSDAAVICAISGWWYAR